MLNPRDDQPPSNLSSQLAFSVVNAILFMTDMQEKIKSFHDTQIIAPGQFSHLIMQQAHVFKSNIKGAQNEKK